MSVIEKLKLGFKDVDSIYESTSHKWDDKKKVDTLLEIGAIIEANLGIDSTMVRGMKPRSNRDIFTER